MYYLRNVAILFLMLTSGFVSGKDIYHRLKEYKQIDELNKRCWEIRRKDPHFAFATANHVLKLSNDINYTQGKAYAAKNIATVKWISAEYEIALEYAEKSRILFESLGNKIEIANMHNLFGLVYTDQGENIRAVNAYENAIAIYDESGDKTLKAATLSNLGIVYYRLGAFNSSLDYYYSALKIYEDTGDYDAMSNTLTNIALIFMAEQKYKEALPLLHNSLAIDLSVKDYYTISSSYNNLGTCFFNMGLTDSALIYHTLAMEFAEKSGNKLFISHSLNNIGELYLSEGNYAEADSCFTIALTLKQYISDINGEITVLLNLSRLYYFQLEFEKAKEQCGQALKLAQHTGSIHQLKDCYFELHLIAESTLQTDESFEYFRKYTGYNEQLLKQETNTKIQRLQLLHVAEKKEKELSIVTNQKIIEQNKKIFYGVIAVFILIIAVITISRQQLKHKKEKIVRQRENEISLIKQIALKAELEYSEKQLEQHRKELSTYTQLLIDKNQLLDELKQNLDAIDLTEDELKEKNRREKMEKLSQARIVTEEDWARFKRLFENVFKGFFLKLRETYPGITNAEIRLAALLKLKLNTKEIAGMTGVSSDSVKKTRQRIRKKMNLGSEDDLEDLINKL